MQFWEQQGVFPTDHFVFYGAALECYMPCSPDAIPHSHYSWASRLDIQSRMLYTLLALSFVSHLNFTPTPGSCTEPGVDFFRAASIS